LRMVGFRGEAKWRRRLLDPHRGAEKNAAVLSRDEDAESTRKV